MAEFSINTQTMTSQSAIIRLNGTLDDDAFDLIEDEFSKILSSGVLGVVLDIDKMENLTSDGLGAFLNLAQALAARGGILSLSVPNATLRETIVMLGVDEALSVEESAEAARKAVVAMVN